MYSKSLFNRNANLERSVINPVGVSGASLIFSQETLNALKAVQEYYTVNMSSKNYDRIPTDYQKFLRLYNIIQTSYAKITNKNLQLLFKITEEGLIGAMNAYGLNFTATELTLENNMLKKNIEDILSGKNVKNAFGSNTGQLTIKKSFTLAPLFSYYIMLYGVPERGVGFDQNKLAMLLSILEKHCIDPYK
jgi:hypothetical protein